MNSRPPDYESGALPLSYCGKFLQIAILGGMADMVPMPLNRLESKALATHACIYAAYSEMPWSGLEPLCLSAPPPQDGVSTNFTTRANNNRVRAPDWLRHRTHFVQKNTGPTGLEPATSRVTVECSNQAELRPQLLESGSETPSSPRTCLETGLVVNQSAAIAPRGIEPLSAP